MNHAIIHFSGYITWNEFHIQFLVSQGHEEKEAIAQAADYDVIPLEAQGKYYILKTYSTLLFNKYSSWSNQALYMGRIS